MKRFLKWAGIGLLVFVVLSAIGGGDKETPRTKPSTQASTTTQTTKKLIAYKILKEEDSAPYKKTYELQVDLVNGRLPSKSELGAISQRLRDPSVERTFVLFYLPGMTVGEGAFATAHHNPNMNVIVNTWALPEQYQGVK